MYESNRNDGEGGRETAMEEMERVIYGVVERTAASSRSNLMLALE